MYDPSGRVLVNQRPKGKMFAGRWEFPGGKIDTGETASQALARELDEELGIRIERQRPLISFTYEYDTLTVRLHVNEVLAYRGVPESLEGQAIQWVEPDNLGQIDLLDANAVIVKAIRLPRICLITDTRRFGVDLTLELLREHAERQRTLVLVREKTMAQNDLRPLVRAVAEICHAAGSLASVHADCAFDEYEAVDGIHFPARFPGRGGLPEGGQLVGVSCHSGRALESAGQGGADYAFLSPVNQTRSHPNAIPLGWQQFAQLCKPVPMPVFALGGMTPADLDTAIEHGAQGIAMLRAAWERQPSGRLHC